VKKAKTEELAQQAALGSKDSNKKLEKLGKRSSEAADLPPILISLHGHTRMA
jgi:hypothetical protein